MPYGSIYSQYAFKAKMDQILEGLKWVVSIANDIVVCGVTEEQLDDNMRKLHGESSVRMVLYSTLINAH